MIRMFSEDKRCSSISDNNELGHHLRNDHSIIQIVKIITEKATLKKKNLLVKLDWCKIIRYQSTYYRQLNINSIRKKFHFLVLDAHKLLYTFFEDNLK